MKHFYEERKQGFEAAWQIPFLARGTPKQWQSEEPAIQSQGFSEVSMDFKPQMDTYRRCLRAVKYQLLFICMTFAILWLFEVLFRLRIHPIQYLLTGVSLCVFYLLLLSLAEHIAFFVAYAVAAMAVVGQVALYSKTMLGGGRRAMPGFALLTMEIPLQHDQREQVLTHSQGVQYRNGPVKDSQSIPHPPVSIAQPIRTTRNKSAYCP